tara:strand:+ start:62 stop:739 length:678 start_codon:yes stop_codon:yes gene_type:complete
MIFIYYILSVYLQDKSVILFNYKSSLYDNTRLLINNIPYRETGVPPNFTGNIAFEFNPGYYNFNLNNDLNKLYWRIFPNWRKIMSTQHKLNDIIVRNTNLVSYNYYSDKDHILHFAYQMALFKQNNNIQFIIEIDNEKTIINSNNGLSIYKNITLIKGYHNINIYSKTNSTWCSCPSIQNGFTNGRYFYAWIEPIDNQVELFTNNIKKIFNINLIYIHIIHLMIQ